MLVAVKANVGHLEGPAASTGLLKLVHVLSGGGSFAGTHLKTLNPHLTTLGSWPSLETQWPCPEIRAPSRAARGRGPAAAP